MNIKEEFRLNPVVDYSKSDKPFVVCRFITECGNKLNAKIITTATALTFFHRYNAASPDPSYDPYLMACASLHIAGKVEDDYIRLRDLINVSLTTLKGTKDPPELDSEYYATREAIVEAELFLLRMINFKTNVEHPHKHLLHHLKSIKEWISPEVWDRYPIANSSWSILQDFHHDPSVLISDPALISLACIQLSLQTYGIAIPYADSPRPWHLVFHPKATNEAIWDVMTKIMEIYTSEASLIHPICSISNSKKIK